MKKHIVVLGDFNPAYYTHHAINAAIEHLRIATSDAIGFRWINTNHFDIQSVIAAEYSGLWIAPGSPYHTMENVLHAITYARENGVSTIGNCGGFQHMLIEFARNVCSIENADTEETNPEGNLLISTLTCSLVDQEEVITIKKNSLLAAILQEDSIIGKYYCNYGLNQDYIKSLESFGMVMTAYGDEGAVRAFELPGHPFFIGTLFQPALTSTAEKPDPLLLAFTKSALGIIM